MSPISILYLAVIAIAAGWVMYNSSRNFKRLEKIAKHIETASKSDYYEAVADDLISYLSNIEQTMLNGSESAAIERLRFKTAEAHNIESGCSLGCIDEPERTRIRKKLTQAIELADRYLERYKG